MLFREYRVPGLPGRRPGPLAKGGRRAGPGDPRPGERREVVDRAGNLVATLEKGKATCTQAKVGIVNKLRVQYSREIVGHAALKLGWQKTMKTENKLLLRKGV